MFGSYTKFFIEVIGGECAAGEHYIETCEFMKGVLMLNKIVPLQALPTYEKF